MEKSSFFNAVLDQSGNPDRVYLAEDFANYFSKFITTGVFSGSTNLQVIANTNDMNITLKAGSAFIGGYMYENTDDLTIPLVNADGVLNRIDRIAIRCDFVTRTISTVVKTGAFASSPVAPSLQRNVDAYEIGIAIVYVGAGAIKIIQSNITDTREDYAVCGIVNNLFADASIQANNITIDDTNNFYISSNVEGALNELKQPLTITKSNADDNGKFTNVTWSNSSGTTVKKSVLSNADADGNYLTRTVTLYDSDGTTITNTKVYTITYNVDGVITSEVLQ